MVDVVLRSATIRIYYLLEVESTQVVLKNVACANVFPVAPDGSTKQHWMEPIIRNQL